MFLESMIFVACSQGKGCTEATTAYYQSSKELQEAALYIDGYAKRLSQHYPTIVYIMTPIYSVAIEGRGSFVMYKTLMCELNFRNEVISLKYTF